jgi:hypothetical protein
MTPAKTIAVALTVKCSKQSKVFPRSDGHTGMEIRPLTLVEPLLEEFSHDEGLEQRRAECTHMRPASFTPTLAALPGPATM